MSKYKDILIYDLYKKLTVLPVADNIDNLFEIIEQTLFEHIVNLETL